MAWALLHRGPDEEGFLVRPGLALAARRLSIVGLADGQQPVSNEDRSISVVFNGELFDYVERREELKARGHKFVTHCDTELIPHLWEDYGEKMWERLRGQFAIALWDERKRQLQLGRDRSESHPFFGRGKTTGFFSRLKLRDCSHQAWSRCAQIAAASITSSRSPPCPVRERVLKVSNFCHLAIF